MTVFLYDIKKRVELTLGDSAETTNWNLPMNVSDFRVFRSVSSAVEFVIRDTDRRPINLIGRTAHITLYDHRSDAILLPSTELTVLNEAKGLVKLTLTADQTDQWSLGSYSYGVTVTDMDGTQRLLYTDEHKSGRGYWEVAMGPTPGPRASLEQLWAEFTPQTEGDPLETYYFSSALPGSMKVGNHAGLHTLTVYPDEFTGKLWIEGSVEEGSSIDANEWGSLGFLHAESNVTYSTASPFQFTSSSTPATFSFTANLQWVRIRMLPDTSVLGQENKITKLIFRN